MCQSIISIPRVGLQRLVVDMFDAPAGVAEITLKVFGFRVCLSLCGTCLIFVCMRERVQQQRMTMYHAFKEFLAPDSLPQHR